MSNHFSYMAALPGSPKELRWIRERLETLSAWEGLVLESDTLAHPPATAAAAINQLLSLDRGAVYLVSGGYAGLGECVLRSSEKNIPAEALEYIDFRALGKRFEDTHPGFFVDRCYAVYPSKAETPPYQGRDSPIPEDCDWSVKLKLASPAVPEGVWLRLPDYPENEPESGSSGEVSAARDVLGVKSLDECTLLETQCVLPEAGEIGKQYDSIEDLVSDCNCLGFILDERGQGEAQWMERFAAALEYEGCHTLRFALDISQNLDCYEWIPCNKMRDIAVKQLRSFGVSDELIQSGCVNLFSYAEDLLETSGYMLTSDENAYVTRNNRKFTFEFCKDEAAAQTAASEQREEAEAYVLPEDILTAFPLMEQISSHAGAEECAHAEQAIREALDSLGSEGLRQLQAAMEDEDCATLETAVEIAQHLDCFDFVDESSFREAVKKEFLEKGLDERAVNSCFDFETYAALTHDFEYIYTSASTGLYVHRNSQFHQQSPMQAQTGMTGPSM